MTSLLLGALTGPGGVLQGAGDHAARTIHDLIFQVIGAIYLSDQLSFSKFSLEFGANSEGVSIDSETGEIRISPEALANGIAVNVVSSDEDGETSGRFEVNLSIREIGTEQPEAPVSAGALADVIAPAGSGPVTVDAAADFTGREPDLYRQWRRRHD